MYQSNAKSRLPISFVVALGFLWGALAFAEGDHHADAKTRIEHLEAAEHYWSQAATAHKNSQAHFTLLGKYEARGLTIVARHCKAIAEQFADMAERYDAMGAEHARLAEEQ